MAKSEVINFSYYSTRYSLVLPDAFDALSKAKLKKLFQYMVIEWNDENDPAIQTTLRQFDSALFSIGIDVADASRAYDAGFIDTKTLPRGGRMAARRTNQALEADLKKARRHYARIKELKAFFTELLEHSRN